MFDLDYHLDPKIENDLFAALNALTEKVKDRNLCDYGAMLNNGYLPKPRYKEVSVINEIYEEQQHRFVSLFLTNDIVRMTKGGMEYADI